MERERERESKRETEIIEEGTFLRKQHHEAWEGGRHPCTWEYYTWFKSSVNCESWDIPAIQITVFVWFVRIRLSVVNSLADVVIYFPPPRFSVQSGTKKYLFEMVPIFLVSS